MNTEYIIASYKQFKKEYQPRWIYWEDLVDWAQLCCGG